MLTSAKATKRCRIDTTSLVHHCVGVCGDRVCVGVLGVCGGTVFVWVYGGECVWVWVCVGVKTHYSVHTVMCQKLVNLNSTHINLSFYFIACTKLGQHHRPVWAHTCTYKTLTFDGPLFLVFSQRPNSLSIPSSRYLSLFFCMYEDWVTVITRTSSLERAAVCVEWCVCVCGVWCVE